MARTEQPLQPSLPTAQVVSFCYLLGAGWGVGLRATCFPCCNAVEQSFTLPTLKALNNVYKMLGNPGRFPI